MKLKTLKELGKPYQETFDYLNNQILKGLSKDYPELKKLKFKSKDNGEIWIRTDELKQEAIKHIKALQKRWKELEGRGNYSKTDFRYWEFDKIQYQIEWIKHFFNITKKELK